MKHVLLLGVLAVLVVVFSCSKKDCVTLPPPVLIRLLDSTGNDLLNHAKPHAYNPNEMEAWYVQNGQPANSRIAIDSFPGTDTFFLSTDMSAAIIGHATYYLKLTPADTDTIDIYTEKIEGKYCSSYFVKGFDYNHISYTQKGIEKNMPFVYEVVK